MPSAKQTLVPTTSDALKRVNHSRARDPNDSVLVVANFTPVVRKGYLVGVPTPGFYRELLNSDSACYGGSNTINFEGVSSEPTSCQGQPHMIMITLPPLGVVFLKREETA